VKGNSDYAGSRQFIANGIRKSIHASITGRMSKQFAAARTIELEKHKKFIHKGEEMDTTCFNFLVTKG